MSEPVLIVHPIPAEPGPEREMALLYKEAYPLVCNALRKAVGWDMAEDSFQDAWVKITAEWASLPPERRTWQYVLAVARGRMLDRLRHDKRAVQRAEKYVAELPAIHLDPRNLPDGMTEEDAARVALVEEALLELPAGQQQDWGFLVQSGYSIQETADATGRTYKGVYASWARTWARMVRKLKMQGKAVSAGEALKIFEEIVEDRERLSAGQSTKLLPESSSESDEENDHDNKGGAS